MQYFNIAVGNKRVQGLIYNPGIRVSIQYSSQFRGSIDYFIIIDSFKRAFHSAKSKSWRKYLLQMESISLNKGGGGPPAATAATVTAQSNASFVKLHSLDLLNIEYDDILHLYRGFRKAEGLLNDKSKEYESLKKSNAELLEANAKAMDRIKSLEGIRDSTGHLEQQIYQLRQQNEQLLQENNELSQVSIQAEEILREKAAHEDKNQRTTQQLASQLQDIQDKYEVLSKTNYELSSQLQQEVMEKTVAAAQVKEAEEESERRGEEVYLLKKKLEEAKERLAACDRDLNMASEQLLELSNEVGAIAREERQVQVSTTENALLRRDVARLLQLLENYPGANGFLGQWRDSNGMSYVGPASLREDKQTLRQIQQRYPLATTAPVPYALEEELVSWVPHEIALQTSEALESTLRSVPETVLLDYLQQMNQIWLRREKAKLQRIRNT